MKIPLFPRSVAVGLWAGLLSCLLTGSQQAQTFSFGGFTTASASTTFSGQAAAVSGFVMGSSVSVANTGPLSVSGDAIEASALETSLASGVSVGASHAAVIGEGSATTTEASVANVNFTSSGGFFVSATTTITADFVMARAMASCVNGVATFTGTAEIDNLVINGQVVTVTGTANQFVFLSDGGYVIINEQATGFGTFTVNAVHIVDTFAGVDVVFGSATAGIVCAVETTPSSSTPPCDFVTGGGWITGTPSGAKANFGVAGGFKNGAFWGHLNYIDHGSGMHVKDTAVTGYTVDSSDANCRYITYNVTIDGAAGTAQVHVCDNGEPGRNDIFQISLSNGYSAGGDLGGSHPGGGNIQLHKCHE